MNWRTTWKEWWSPQFSFDGSCSCDQGHMALLVKDQKMCPCLYWARTCMLILERKGLAAMNSWMKSNPLGKFIKRIGEKQDES